jgi:hypothetical protein
MLVIDLPLVDTLAAVPFVLYLPGAALNSAFDLTDPDTTWERRLFWSVSISIPIVVFGAFLLNGVADIDRTTIVLLLGSWTILLSLVAIIRHGRWVPNSSSEGATLQLQPLSPPSGTGTPAIVHSAKRRKGVLTSAFVLGLSCIVVAAAFVLTQHSITSTNAKFVQLWLLPAPSGSANTLEASVGARNSEASTIQVVVSVHSSRTGAPSYKWNLTLAAGAQWSAHIQREPAATLTATLALASDPNKIVEHTFLNALTYVHPPSAG